MEDKISKKVKLENAFFFIGLFSILLSLIIAVNYENVFLAEILLLVVVLMILVPLGKYINTLDEKNWRMANIEELYRGQEVLVLQFKDSSVIGGINYEKEFRVYDFYDEYISLIDEYTPDNLGRSFTEYLFKREELENNIMIPIIRRENKMKHTQSQDEKKYFVRSDLKKYYYSERSVPKHEEIITLIKFLHRYSQSEKYSSVIENEKDVLLKSLLIKYKVSFLEDVLRTEVMSFKEMSIEKDISLEDPEVGDLLIALGRLE